MKGQSPRVLIVTGKGGVGKTTVSMALGLAFVECGLRTVICETAGSTRVPEAFGVDGQGYTLTELRPSLWTMSITPEEAMEDYIVQQIRIRRLYKLVFGNRIMSAFVDAVPGLHDAVTLGKVYDLARRTRSDGQPEWDRIVVDAPATGHGLTMLGSTRSFMELTRSGPMYEGVKLVHDVLDQPDVTGLVLVALPEEMPVKETLDLWHRLGDSQAQVRGCVLNEVHERPRFEPGEWQAARPAFDGDDAVREATALTDRWMERVARQDECRRRLAGELGLPVVDMPFRFHRDLAVDELADLGRGLMGDLEAR